MISIASIYNDCCYKKWYENYENDLRIMFYKMTELLKNKGILYKEYEFSSFCRMIYNKSSKRIV
jgi:hypothetical protein